METAGGTHFPLASQSGWQATAQEGSFAVSEKGGMVVMGCWFAIVSALTEAIRGCVDYGESCKRAYDESLISKFDAHGR